MFVFGKNKSSSFFQVSDLTPAFTYLYLYDGVFLIQLRIGSYDKLIG